jgi:hypothetical protein
MYDPMTNAWTELTPDMSMARGYIATELMPDGLIYLAGGSQVDASGALSDETIFEKFNPTNNTITTGPAMPQPSSNNLGYNVAGQFVVPMGGYLDENHTTTVHMYNPATNSWGALPSGLHTTRNYSKGYGLAGAIHVIGGLDTQATEFYTYNQKYTPGGCVTPSPVTNTPTRTITPTGVVTPPTFTRTPSATPGSPTATVTPCVMTFIDVNPTDYFYEAVRYLYCAGVISGYNDNTFRPYNNATRGQMTKIIILAFGYPIYTPPTPTFTDVPVDNPFYQYIETAAFRQIVSGYSDGTFRPFNDVTRGQLSKIDVIAAQWPLINPTTPTFSDVPVENPFYTYIETAYCHQIITGYNDGTFRWANNATRGQISKIVYLSVTNTITCEPPDRIDASIVR